MQTDNSILRIQSLTKSFSGLLAVNGASFDVRRGVVTSVIGPNGAGKTTLFNLITGYIRPDSGKVLFKGENITNLPPHKINHKGMSRSFQIVNIFPQLTVFENVQAAVISRMGRSRNFIASARAVGREDVMRTLDSVGLAGQARALAGTLAYGDQRIMEMAIALASDT